MYILFLKQDLNKTVKQLNAAQNEINQMNLNISVLANHTKELTEIYNEITMALAADANLKFLIPFNGPFGQS
jgi:uncharacterized protein YoxC